MTTLAKMAAWQVFDSRGCPTIEVEAIGSDGSTGRAMVPSNAYPGRHEARELRDGDARRHDGLGVARAGAHVVAELGPAAAGIDVDDQEACDAAFRAADGTPDKSRLGANAVSGASMALARLAAAARGDPLHVHLNRIWRAGLATGESGEPTLPTPMIQMIAGGLHAGAQLDFQDFLIVPIAATTFSEAIELAGEVHRSLGRVLLRRGEEFNLVGDQGGYGPRLRTNASAVERILEAALAIGLTPGRDLAIALDVAASHFYEPEAAAYHLITAGDESHDASGMIGLLEHWTRQYPIASIEDGLAQDDWEGWTALTARLGGTTQLVGDDLFATRADRIEQGARRGAANAASIVLGQAGTLSETFDAIRTAHRSGYRTVVSARSGETEDAFIADLAVATAAGQIKIGSLARSERLAKYNRLLRIEAQLGPSARYAGARVLISRPGEPRPNGPLVPTR